MKMEVEMGVYWGRLEVQIHQKYIGKTKQNRWKTKRRARKRATGATTGHHGPWCSPRPGRGAHWLWWLLGSPNAAFWSFDFLAWAASFCLSWGILGLFASFF